jgi:hypothetical protein
MFTTIHITITVRTRAFSDPSGNRPCVLSSETQKQSARPPVGVELYHCLCPGHESCGPQTRSNDTTWALVNSAESQAPAQPTEAEPMFSQHSHAVNISDSRGNSLCNIRNPSFLYRKIMPLLRVSVKKDA